MIITCLAHAKFLMTLEDGTRVVTDPYDASTGYPVAPMAADLVLVSHQHHDHNAVDTLRDYTLLVDHSGDYTLSTGVTVRAVPAWHDSQGGALRGQTLLFVLEAEGLRVAHLGDLGHVLTNEQVAALGRVDVLLLPVGGHFTIDAAQAKQVCEQLHPRVIVPMHYRTAVTASWPIAPVDDFISAMSMEAETLDLLRVTAGDLSCQPHLAILRPQA